jgi:hypothetical protein
MTMENVSTKDSVCFIIDSTVGENLIENKHVAWILFISNTGYQQKPLIDDLMYIYVAAFINGELGPAMNLGEPVNSVHPDG